MGHSTRTIEEFVTLLHAGEVEVVVDVRKIPRSRTNPQYNQEVLGENLQAYGIEYLYFSELGGRRNKSKEIPSDVNGFWENRSFHNYADHALSEEFRQGLSRLIKLGYKKRCAVMCSEAVWWRCHRRIIADYLLAHGEAVFHLMGNDRMESAQLTRGAVIESAEEVFYRAPATSSHL